MLDTFLTDEPLASDALLGLSPEVDLGGATVALMHHWWKHYSANLEIFLFDDQATIEAYKEQPAVSKLL